MWTNYFKVVTGSQAAHTLKQEVFGFNDSEPQTIARALEAARDAFGFKGSVSVFRRTLGVSPRIAIIGDSPDESVQ